VNFTDPWGLFIEKVEWSPLTPISCVLWGAQYSGGLCYLYAARFLGEQRLTATQYGGDLRGVSKAGSKLGRRFVKILIALTDVKNTVANRFALSAIREPCQDDLAALGVSAADIATALREMRILSGVGSDVLVRDVYPPGTLPQGWSDKRVGDLFGPRGRIRALAEFEGNRVWVNPRRGGAGIDVNDDEANGALLMHEALHNLGLVDEWIQGALGLEPGAPSENISEKLAEDCL